jgi:SAM-dependent methyltransferase
MRQLRFYQDLARFWPLISPVEEYAGEAHEFRRLLRSAPARVETVLELGSGGGSNAYHLKRDFRLTLSDLSEDMLAVSRGINPECEHIQGDMRTLDLGRTFDAVFIHDAIDYMTSESDLATAIATAFRHCRAGGVALFVPDVLAESFEPDSDCGGSDGVDGAGVRYLEWSYDPDPEDGWGVTHYSFIVRERDGGVSTVSETHRFGLFSRVTWIRLLEAQGFVVEALEERTDEERKPRLLFRCLRPDSQDFAATPGQDRR